MSSDASAALPPELARRFGASSPRFAGETSISYEGRDPASQRVILVKVLRDVAAPTAAERQRIVRELERLPGVKHPVLPRAIASGDLNGRVYAVRELVEGEVLTSRLARGPMSVREATRVALSLAGALDALHRQGLTHRDLRPGHVLLQRSGAVWLLDACMARVSRAHDGRSFLGAPGYAAPEVLTGKLVSPRSDLYALGAVLYEMLAGAPPYGPPDARDVTARQCDSDAPVLRVPVPDALAKLIASLLARDARERPFSAPQVERALEAFAFGGDGEETGAISNVAPPAEGDDDDETLVGNVPREMLAARGLLGKAKEQVAREASVKASVPSPASASKARTGLGPPPPAGAPRPGQSLLVPLPGQSIALSVPKVPAPTAASPKAPEKPATPALEKPSERSSEKSSNKSLERPSDKSLKLGGAAAVPRGTAPLAPTPTAPVAPEGSAAAVKPGRPQARGTMMGVGAAPPPLTSPVDTSFMAPAGPAAPSGDFENDYNTDIQEKDPGLFGLPTAPPKKPAVPTPRVGGAAPSVRPPAAPTQKHSAVAVPSLAPTPAPVVRGTFAGPGVPTPISRGAPDSEFDTDTDPSKRTSRAVAEIRAESEGVSLGPPPASKSSPTRTASPPTMRADAVGPPAPNAIASNPPPPPVLGPNARSVAPSSAPPALPPAATGARASVPAGPRVPTLAGGPSIPPPLPPANAPQPSLAPASSAPALPSRPPPPLPSPQAAPSVGASQPAMLAAGAAAPLATPHAVQGPAPHFAQPAPTAQPFSSGAPLMGTPAGAYPPSGANPYAMGSSGPPPAASATFGAPPGFGPPAQSPPQAGAPLLYPASLPPTPAHDPFGPVPGSAGYAADLPEVPDEGARRRSRLPWVFAGLGIAALAGVGGYVFATRATPTETPRATPSAARTAAPSVVPTAPAPTALSSVAPSALPSSLETPSALPSSLETPSAVPSSLETPSAEPSAIEQPTAAPSAAAPVAPTVAPARPSPAPHPVSSPRPAPRPAPVTAPVRPAPTASAPAAGGDPTALARAAIARRDYASARTLLSSAVRANPRDAALHFAYGDVLARLRDTPAALLELRTAARLAPGNALYLRRLAEVQIASGDRAGAVNTLQQLLAVNPSDGAARAALNRLGGAH